MSKPKSIHLGLLDAPSYEEAPQPVACHFRPPFNYAYRATKDAPLVNCQSCLNAMAKEAAP